jgi:hypothetical protein
VSLAGGCGVLVVVVVVVVFVCVAGGSAGAGGDAGATFFSFLGGEPRFMANLSRVRV